ADLWQQHTLATFDWDVVVVLLKSKSARHAATAGIEHLQLQAETLQNLLFAFHPHDRLLMAVAVDDRAPLQFAFRIIGSALHEEFAQRERLLPQSPGIEIVREKIR